VRPRGRTATRADRLGQGDFGCQGRPVPVSHKTAEKTACCVPRRIRGRTRTFFTSRSSGLQVSIEKRGRSLINRAKEEACTMPKGTEPRVRRQRRDGRAREDPGVSPGGGDADLRLLPAGGEPLRTFSDELSGAVVRGIPRRGWLSSHCFRRSFSRSCSGVRIRNPMASSSLRRSRKCLSRVTMYGG
jgi:hypothetical protein